MPMLYTTPADRKRLGVEAGSLLAREAGAREAMETETATVLPLKSTP